MNIENIISDIQSASKSDMKEFDFSKCFDALREMDGALKECKATFDFFREVRGCDGALKKAVIAVDTVLDKD